MLTPAISLVKIASSAISDLFSVAFVRTLRPITPAISLGFDDGAYELYATSSIIRKPLEITRKSIRTVILFTIKFTKGKTVKKPYDPKNLLSTQEQLTAKRDALIARYEKEAREKKAHKLELAEKHGLVDHPKLGLLYEKAWQHGHANGWSEVAFWFEDLAELVR